MYWTGFTPDEAREILVNKDKSKKDKRMGLAEAINTFVKDGYNIGIAGFVNSRQPVAAIHEIIRQKKKDLTLSFQSAGLALEYLAGAMALNPALCSIKRMEFAYWAHESFGISPLFRYLAESGKVELEDWSNFNMSARFKAGAMGIPFIPCRSPLGSDVMQANRSQIMDCPFTDDPVALLPAAHPHVALVHVQEADIYGNCKIQGPLFTCPEIAMAAGYTILTCERIVEHESIVSDPNRVNIPFFSVDAVVEVPFGAYPGNCHSHYYFDDKHIKELQTAGEAFRKGDRAPLEMYYDHYIYGVQNTAEFLSQIPYNQLQHIQQIEIRDFRLIRGVSRQDTGDSYKTSARSVKKLGTRGGI
ncbi:CoA transferase subunit A [Desulfoscipio gibsoniae]|uniref:Acyl CoA:acetate/3-ketoacid CoA transferase, alpha subunit n=1 Tax=Desulfoscipio gibsoniae DSM 7213 TaxID=767817 RepID=R4KCD6_9FIRM|nr:CoA-transferase [Desulfoscipio gibsoniae]AGL00848.1 acyl CoA:acetate/3-ketoacid CoA transferase, alpha subunit [Desulfoscipio gibsoniae DSM 7213]